MSRLIKFTWFLTTLLFLGILLWSYAYLPANVGVGADAGGYPNEFLEKEAFFYLALCVFIFFNVILFSSKKLIDNSISKRGYSPQRSLQHDLSDWLLAFAASINIFLVLGLVYLDVFNNSDGVNLNIYGPVVFAGPVLVGILLVVLGVILLKKRA